MHGHFKSRLEQHLLLRGSRDFESESAYDLFVLGFWKSNGLRTVRLAEELAAMREHLPGVARLHGDDGAGEQQLDDPGVQAGLFGSEQTHWQQPAGAHS